MSTVAFWRAQIISAAADPDGDKMQAMAARLEACSRTMQLLLNKGYRIDGRQLDVIVAAMPNACAS